jgi:hypothetical protein
MGMNPKKKPRAMSKFFYHFSTTVFGASCVAAIVWQQHAIIWIVTALGCLWLRQTLQINVFLQYAIAEGNKLAAKHK